MFGEPLFRWRWPSLSASPNVLGGGRGIGRHRRKPAGSHDRARAKLLSLLLLRCLHRLHLFLFGAGVGDGAGPRRPVLPCIPIGQPPIIRAGGRSRGYKDSEREQNYELGNPFHEMPPFFVS